MDTWNRIIDGWHSPHLGQGMPIVSYGHWGHPLLLYPTAAADFLENERFHLVGAIEPQIRAGKVRVFSIDSINRQAWMDRKLPVQEQARRQMLYSQYVEEEVVPYIRHICGAPDIRIATTGASFGAFHAANALFRRPDLFDGVIGMAGFYDLGPDYFKGYSDDSCFYNNPAWYLPNLGGRALEQHHLALTDATGLGDPRVLVVDRGRRDPAEVALEGLRDEHHAAEARRAEDLGGALRTEVRGSEVA